METASSSVQPQTTRVLQTGYPAGGLRFDWAFVGLSILFTAGLWVDGWAHFHGQVDDSFFTPWHFLFYSAFGINALFIGVNQWRNLNKGFAFRRALPEGYWLALVGAAMFAVGGVADMIWHTLFGIEAGSEALTSPSHIVLAVGMCLIFTGPLRAAWLRGNALGWRNLGPAVISAALLLAMFGFFTSYAHPVINPVAAMMGSQAEQVESVNQIYVMNADGSGQTLLVASRDNQNYSPVWSPDGTQIAFSRLSGVSTADDSSDVYVINADGSNLRQLTSADGSEFSPVWSPDGTQIAYIYQTDSLHEIFIMNADGSGEPLQITDNADDEWPAQWSPDGTKLIYGINGGGDFVLIDTDGANAARIDPGMKAWQPVWTPDGGKIIFSGQNEGGIDVYSMNVDGSGVTRLSQSDSFDSYATISPDGQQILFMSWRSGLPELYTMPVTGETADRSATNISNNTALEPTDSAWSSDGSKILFNATGRTQSGGSNFATQDFGVGSILLQAGLMIGIVLFMAWRWLLPFGAVTLMLAGSTLLLTLLNDFYILALGALVTGLIADVLAWRLKPNHANESGFHLFAFVVPMIFFALYFLTLQAVGGIGWNVHVWGGAIFMSGMLGLLVSYLISGSAAARETAS